MKGIVIYLGLFLISIMIACGLIIFIHATYYPYISKQTEEKYIRNISNYEYYKSGSNYMHINPISGGDSLAWISQVINYEIDPFRKWKIDEVGAVRRGSELHRLLDSIENTIEKVKNKYE